MAGSLVAGAAGLTGVTATAAGNTLSGLDLDRLSAIVASNGADKGDQTDRDLVREGGRAENANPAESDGTLESCQDGERSRENRSGSALGRAGDEAEKSKAEAEKAKAEKAEDAKASPSAAPEASPGPSAAPEASPSPTAAAETSTSPSPEAAETEAAETEASPAVEAEANGTVSPEKLLDDLKLKNLKLRDRILEDLKSGDLNLEKLTPEVGESDPDDRFSILPVPGCESEESPALPTTPEITDITQVPCDSDELVAALVRANAEGGGNLELAADCTYTLTTPEQNAAESGLPVIYHPITIDGAGATITRAVSAEAFRFFTIRGGGELKLVDLKLVNGRASIGGSIQVDHDATATIERTTITQSTAISPVPENPEDPDDPENAANKGGGAIFNDGHLTVTDSTFSDNKAAGGSGKGGAILNGGVFTMSESEFTNNSADVFGGAFANYQGAADVATSTFAHNSAAEGGGIASVNARTKVWDIEATRNSATLGGGIVNRDAVITLRNVKVHHNTATTHGGGIATVRGLVASDDNLIEDNTARGNGAGIYASTSNLLVRTSEVNRNSGVGSPGKGGGIHVEKGQITVFNSRVVENNATEKPGGLYAKDAQVKIDNRTRITQNRPTNCATAIDNCFG